MSVEETKPATRRDSKSEKSEADLRVEIAADYERRFAELEARLAAATTAVNTAVTGPPPSAPKNNFMLGFDPNAPIIQEGEKVLVHFIEDGYTVGASIYYRGQEAELLKSEVLPEREQLRRFRQVYYRVGAWQGEGYDLSDPNLTDDDRRKLQSLMAN